MTLSEELLEEAKSVLSKSTPTEAAARRAVSTAYYAVFHLLSESVASIVCPASPSGLREQVRRALDHGRMKAAAIDFASRNLPRHIAPLITTQRSQDILDVAGGFVSLQEYRHKADYDISAKFDMAWAGTAIALAEQVFIKWARIEHSDEAHVFLASLMFERLWNK